MSLVEAVANLRTLVAGLQDMVACYDQPPPNLPAYPSGLVYIYEGEIAATGDQQSRGLHTLAVEIHISRTVVPEAVASATIWPERLFNALVADYRLGGAVSHVNWPMTYRAMPILYGTETHYAVRCLVQVKIQ